MSALGQLRTALEAALAADPALQAVLGDPLRLAPARSRHLAYPHASWGRMTCQARGSDDTDLVECRLTLEIWCRDSDAHAVTGQVRQRIRALSPVLPAGVQLISLEPVYADVFQTANQRLQRGLVRIRALLQAQAEETTP